MCSLVRIGKKLAFFGRPLIDEAANEVDESMLNEHLAVPVVQYLREIAGEAHVAYVTHHGVRREQHGHAADPLRPVLLALGP